MKIVFMLTIFFSTQTHAQFIGVKFNQRRWSIKQTNNKFIYRDGKADRAFVIKKCNKQYFKQFWKDFDKKFKTKTLPPKDAPDYVRLNFKSQFYRIDTNSDLGIFLQNIQTNLQNIQFEESVNCNKMEAGSQN